MTAYKITLNMTNSGRWQGWLAPAWSGYYTAHCCERGHRGPKAALRHGFRIIRDLVLTDLGDLDSTTAGYAAAHGRDHKD